MPITAEEDAQDAFGMEIGRAIEGVTLLVSASMAMFGVDRVRALIVVEADGTVRVTGIDTPKITIVPEIFHRHAAERAAKRQARAEA